MLFDLPALNSDLKPPSLPRLRPFA